MPADSHAAGCMLGQVHSLSGRSGTAGQLFPSPFGMGPAAEVALGSNLHSGRSGSSSPGMHAIQRMGSIATAEPLHSYPPQCQLSSLRTEAMNVSEVLLATETSGLHGCGHTLSAHGYEVSAALG